YGPTTHEAQGSGWDSGGGMFVFNNVNSQWELAGVMVAVGSYYPDAPRPVASDHTIIRSVMGYGQFEGHATLAVDLAPHRAQIVRFMVTPRKDANATALNGANASMDLMNDPVITGGVSMSFASATDLKVTAGYQTIF